MRKLVVERFDGKYAICEGEGKDGEVRKFAIPAEEVPSDVKAGVCIIINDDGEIIIDEAETQLRREEVRAKENKLFK
ncbi:MAG: DUF3006 domain-containing protein [Clostridia bacterium]|nr:DUF3006 domain-containing protein [Clostridia bacterium]